MTSRWQLLVHRFAVCFPSLTFPWPVTNKHILFNLLSPNSQSNPNFSFQFIANYVWYSMENLAGDLLLSLIKFVRLPILPTLFIHFVQGRLGELRSGYSGLEGLKQNRKDVKCGEPAGHWSADLLMNGSEVNISINKLENNNNNNNNNNKTCKFVLMLPH